MARALGSKLLTRLHKVAESRKPELIECDSDPDTLLFFKAEGEASVPDPAPIVAKAALEEEPTRPVTASYASAKASSEWPMKRQFGRISDHVRFRVQTYGTTVEKWVVRQTASVPMVRARVRRAWTLMAVLMAAWVARAQAAGHHLWLEISNSLTVLGRRLGTRRERSEERHWPAGLSLFTCGVAVGALLVTLVPFNQRDGNAVPTSAESNRQSGTPAGVALPVATSATSGASEPVPVSANGVVTQPRRPLYRGTLVVNSRPRGATVFLNERRVGRTPLVLRQLPAGSRAVRVDLDGYTSWSRGVRVVANESTAVVAQLDRDPIQIAAARVK